MLACLVSVSFCFITRIEPKAFTLGHPWDDKKAEGNPYNTIFVGRLNYTTTEDRLKREFEIYGPVEGVRVVKNKNNKKSRGYAFVEFRNERDADCKLKLAITFYRCCGKSRWSADRRSQGHCGS